MNYVRNPTLCFYKRLYYLHMSYLFYLLYSQILKAWVLVLLTALPALFLVDLLEV